MATGPYGVDDSAFRHLLETDYSEYERRVEEEFTKNKYREELGREYDQKVAQGAIQPEAVQPVAGGDKSSLTKSDPMQTYENFGPKGGGMTSGAAARSQRRQEFRGLLEGLLADSLMQNRKRREQFPMVDPFDMSKIPIPQYPMPQVGQPQTMGPAMEDQWYYNDWQGGQRFF